MFHKKHKPKRPRSTLAVAELPGDHSNKETCPTSPRAALSTPRTRSSKSRPPATPVTRFRTPGPISSAAASTPSSPPPNRLKKSKRKRHHEQLAPSTDTGNTHFEKAEMKSTNTARLDPGKTQMKQETRESTVHRVNNTPTNSNKHSKRPNKEVNRRDNALCHSRRRDWDVEHPSSDYIVLESDTEQERLARYGSVEL